MSKRRVWNKTKQRYVPCKSDRIQRTEEFWEPHIEDLLDDMELMINNLLEIEDDLEYLQMKVAHIKGEFIKARQRDIEENPIGD